MLAVPSRLALPGLFLSLVAATPALAQSRPAGPEGGAVCYRTIAERSGPAETSQPADSRCGEPAERNIHGGWLAHAIMMVGDSGPVLAGAARPATAWRAAEPRFAVPPVYR